MTLWGLVLAAADEFARALNRFPEQAMGLLGLFLGVAAAVVAYASAAENSWAQTAFGWISLFSGAWLSWFAFRNVRRFVVQRRRETRDFQKDVSKFRAVLGSAKSPIVGAFAKRALESVVTLYCGTRVPLVVADQRDGQSVFRQVVTAADPAWADGAVRELAHRAKAMATAWNEQHNEAEIRANVSHALVFDPDLPDTYNQGLNEIRCTGTDYVRYRSVLEFLRDSPPDRSPMISVPIVLGSGGFLVYPDDGEVVVQRRSAAVDTQPKKLHVFGGNFEPDIKVPGLGHDLDLRSNAAREIAEESRALINVDDCVVALHKERTIQSQMGERAEWAAHSRFLPAHFLGIVLTKAERARLKGSAEGEPHPIVLTNLVSSLRDTGNWVPAAWLTIMLWLYLGAPCQGGQRFMSSWRARRMFKDVLRK